MTPRDKPESLDRTWVKEALNNFRQSLENFLLDPRYTDVTKDEIQQILDRIDNKELFYDILYFSNNFPAREMLDEIQDFYKKVLEGEEPWLNPLNTALNKYWGKSPIYERYYSPLNKDWGFDTVFNAVRSFLSFTIKEDKEGVEEKGEEEVEEEKEEGRHSLDRLLAEQRNQLGINPAGKVDEAEAFFIIPAPRQPIEDIEQPMRPPVTPSSSSHWPLSSGVFSAFSSGVPSSSSLPPRRTEEEEGEETLPIAIPIPIEIVIAEEVVIETDSSNPAVHI